MVTIPILHDIGWHTGLVQDIDKYFSIHKFQCAVQDMQELPQIVPVSICMIM